MVQFKVLLACPYAEHGTGKGLEVAGEVFRPTEWGEQVLAAASAMFFDMFDQLGAVLGGTERVAQFGGEGETMTRRYLSYKAAGFIKQMAHGTVGESSQGDHDFGLTRSGAEGFFAHADTDECTLAEAIETDILTAIERMKILDDFGDGECRAEPFFWGRGMGAAPHESVDNACGSGSKGMAVENNSPQWVAGEVVESVDGSEIILLEDACVEDFLGACAGFFLGLEDKCHIAALGDAALGNELGQLEQDGGMAVVAAAVADGQSVNVATDSDGGK